MRKKKEFHARLSWTNTPVQEAKASRKFGVLFSFSRWFKSESPVLQNGVWDFQNSEYLKSYRDFTSFSKTQAKETCEKDVKTMKNENFKIPRYRFVKQTIPIVIVGIKSETEEWQPWFAIERKSGKSANSFMRWKFKMFNLQSKLDKRVERTKLWKI